MEEEAGGFNVNDMAGAVMSQLGAGVNYASAKMGTQSYSAGTLTGSR